MAGDPASTSEPVPIAWATSVEGEPARSSKRHLWDEVPWEVARDWPAKRLRTLCGMVVPRAAVPGSPADLAVPAVQALADGERTELAPCERCERARQVRWDRPAGPGVGAGPEQTPGSRSG
jgi:hypothetical protein